MGQTVTLAAILSLIWAIVSFIGVMGTLGCVSMYNKAVSCGCMQLSTSQLCSVGEERRQSGENTFCTDGKGTSLCVWDPISVGCKVQTNQFLYEKTCKPGLLFGEASLSQSSYDKWQSSVSTGLFTAYAFFYGLVGLREFVAIWLLLGWGCTFCGMGDEDDRKEKARKVSVFANCLFNNQGMNVLNGLIFGLPATIISFIISTKTDGLFSILAGVASLIFTIVMFLRALCCHSSD